MIANLPSWLLAVGVGLAALVGWLWWHAAIELWQGWTLWRNDPVAVMDAANVTGAVEVEGTAASGGRTLKSPFTGTPTLVCEYKIQEWKSSGKNSHWETLHENLNAVPFLLEDDSGSVAIDPDGAEYSLERDAEIESDGGETPPEEIQEFLDSVGVEREEGGETSIGPLSIHHGDRRRYIERRIDAGDEIHVYGQSRHGRSIGDVSGTVNAVIGSGKATPRFRISKGSESDAIRRQIKSGATYAIFGAVIVAIAGAFVVGGL